MIQVETLAVPGAFLITRTPFTDERGSFCRVHCDDLFEKHGLNTDWKQTNLSYSKHAGTVRGLHFQLPPAEESKLVTPISGKLFDVFVDLRKDSPTYLQTFSITLSSNRNESLQIPPGCAHGYQSLTNDTTILFYHSSPFTPELERSINATDSQLAIPWPLAIHSRSQKDQVAPSLNQTLQSL